jgi:hypothetical protein
MSGAETNLPALDQPLASLQPGIVQWRDVICHFQKVGHVLLRFMHKCGVEALVSDMRQVIGELADCCLFARGEATMRTRETKQVISF